MNEVVKSILAGEHDADLEAIGRSLNDRMKAIRSQRAAEITAALRAGDRVRLNGNVRPAGLAGKEGVVTAFGRTRLSVRFDGDLVDTRCPPNVLDKVGDAPVETADQATVRLVAAFKAEHAPYPQYAHHIDGAVAVPLRRNWTGRGEKLAKGTFVLLVKADVDVSEIGADRIRIWHPNMACETVARPSDVVLPR